MRVPSKNIYTNLCKFQRLFIGFPSLFRTLHIQSNKTYVQFREILAYRSTPVFLFGENLIQFHVESDILVSGQINSSPSYYFTKCAAYSLWIYVREKIGLLSFSFPLRVNQISKSRSQYNDLQYKSC